MEEERLFKLDTRGTSYVCAVVECVEDVESGIDEWLAGLQ